MNPSFGNHFQGIITHVAPGIYGSALRIKIGNNQVLTAVAPGEQHLQVGAMVLAMVKPSWVKIGKDNALPAGAHNQLSGRISRINAGPVDSEIDLDLGQGRRLCAIISNASTSDLREGDFACAYFKASRVVITIQ